MFGRDRSEIRGSEIAGSISCILMFFFTYLILQCEAMAAEWFIEGRVDLTGNYDDNIRLNPNDQEDVWGAIVTPEIDFHGRGTNWDVNFTTQLDIARYTEDESLNSNDVLFFLDSFYETQLGQWSLDGEASRVSTLYTEATDSGNFNTNADRDLVSLTPSWSYYLSQRDFVAADFNWTQATYDTDQLDDYRQFFISGTWGRQLTPLDLGYVSILANRFESESIVDLESHLVGLLFGWDRNFSERLDTSLSLGPRYYWTESPVLTPTGIGVQNESSLGFLASGDLEYDLLETTQVSVGLSHGIEPTSSGTPLNRTTFEADISHRFLPLWTVGLGAYFRWDTSPTDDNGIDRDQNFFSIEPRFTWRVAADLELSTRYRFRTLQSRDDSRAYGNAVFFTLTYRTSKWDFANIF